jgi:hypothetical protein
MWPDRDWLAIRAKRFGSARNRQPARQPPDVALYLPEIARTYSKETVASDCVKLLCAVELTSEGWAGGHYRR